MDCFQVFPGLDFLGWYSTGESPSEEDIEIHRQICEIEESPLFLLLNPAARHTDLPVSVFESIIDLVSGVNTLTKKRKRSFQNYEYITF